MLGTVHASIWYGMLRCLQKHFLHHVQIPLQTDKLLYKSYYSMWINHTCRFTRLESWKRKSALESRIFGIHNHPTLRKWRKEYLHIRIFLVFTIFSNTHTHTHTQHSTHNTHTHSSLSRLEIPKQDIVTANQIYFWAKERKLCCCRQLCYRTAPWCLRVYALSAPCTQIRGLFSIVYFFIAIASNSS